ncbi:hypothetical protein RCZ04_00170 [Capnocytophaga sp. HP1101]
MANLKVEKGDKEKSYKVYITDSTEKLVATISPNNIQDELIEEGHKDIFYNSATNETTIK